MHKLRLVCGIMMVAGALVAEARADVSMPKFFTDDMMLQRDKAIRVWGWAAPGEEVKVTLAGKTVTAGNAATKADDKGKWSVELPALKAGENLELTVSGKNTITLKNVIMGDIWLCSGQSNMEMMLEQCFGAEDIKSANYPKIRHIKINCLFADLEEEDIQPGGGPWTVCSPNTAGKYTAAGYFFALEIFKRTGVPIGLINSTVGGTPIQAWTAPEGLDMIPELKEERARWLGSIDKYRKALPKAMDDMDKWMSDTTVALKTGANVNPAPPMPDHPSNAWYGWMHLYNSMIHPLIRVPIKGALWYQGENNGSENELYYQKMRALIGGWRKVWGQEDLPFYFVQLANLDEYGGIRENGTVAGGSGFSGIREAQLKACRTIPNSGMAVDIDIGESRDCHPHNKYDVGLRLGRWALNRDYGFKDVVVSGPLYKEMKIEGGKIRVSFDYVAGGLMVGKKDYREPVVADKDGKLKRFAIAGADKVWHWADAVIDGETVVVSSPEVKEPVAVRYAFSMDPVGANLYNKEGLPASPFRTDNWEIKP